jgi:uncharacterized protein
MLVWIDLDNSPHVHFFAPLITALRLRGVESLITVRSHAQTEELARTYGLKFRVIGRHPTSTHFVGRAAETTIRAIQLAAFARRFKPTIAISHGSRALTLAAWAMRVPAMLLFDYEHTSKSLINLPDKTLVPDVIPRDFLGMADDKLAQYPGFKEEVYIYDFKPDREVLSQLNIDPSRLLVTLRPPATWAHYHDPLSDRLFVALVERFRAERDAQVIVMPRTPEQAAILRAHYRMDAPPFRILDHAVDALSLMWFSDAVFSGGGTMVREAALLGVKTYSIFGGKLGAADQALVNEGKLHIVRDPQELESLQLAKSPGPLTRPTGRTQTRDFIIREIVDFLYHHARVRPPEAHIQAA